MGQLAGDEAAASDNSMRRVTTRGWDVSNMASSIQTLAMTRLSRSLWFPIAVDMTGRE
jgi:hypothetical protein